MESKIGEEPKKVIVICNDYDVSGGCIEIFDSGYISPEDHIDVLNREIEAFSLKVSKDIRDVRDKVPLDYNFASDRVKNILRLRKNTFGKNNNTNYYKKAQ